MMKVIHIENSYKIWHPNIMWGKITIESWTKYHTLKANEVLSRSYKGMYVEWYLHNLGYWLTLPFIKNVKIKALNERFKHVDLEEYL